MPGRQTFKPLDLPVTEPRPLKRSEVAAIQSSVLAAAPESVVVFSLLFRHGPAPEGREALRNVHVILKNALSEVRSEARFREAYRGLVNKLIEPGLRRRSALKAHSFTVGRMARKLASRIGLGAMEIEQITVAAILHDIGIGELNYDDLYTKRSLNEEELKLLRLHPRVGAFIVDEIPWPYPIGPLVRHHHERWDGSGYPDGLRAEQIPLGARIIHLCEAFDAMTSPTSYRAVLPHDQALDILVSKAGTQFDPELAPEFRKMVEGKGD
jgi:HD-GYP domain-containing protein (c-di-GMP phosphodiesterase class II)